MQAVEQTSHRELTDIPQGFRKNALGHLVPESQVKQIDILRDDLVKKLVSEAKALQQTMASFKLMAMGEVNAFVDVSASEHGVKFGGAKGNVTLLSYDGQYKVCRAMGEHRIFDERIQAAKALIDDCIKRWSEGTNDHIRALVEHAFKVNAQGYIDVNQVLSLRQLDIDDANWNKAMDAISDSIQISKTTPYLRVYERQDDGSYQAISLDFARL